MRPRLQRLFLGCLALFSLAACRQAADQPPALAAARSPAGPPTLHWSVAVGDGLAAPAQASGPVVVVATEQAVIALEPASGAEVWRYAPAEGLWPRSLAVGNGLVLVGGPGRLVALEAADGRPLWQQATTGEVLWPPFIGQVVLAGTAYVGPGVAADPDGRAWAYALEPASGELLWSAETESYSLVTPVVAGGLAIFGGSRMAESEVEEGGHLRLYAFDQAGGGRRWTADFQDGFLKSLASDGERLYYLAYTDMVYGLEAATGRELWRYPTENWSPGFAFEGGSLYLGSDNAFVHALDGATGQARWRTGLAGIFNAPRARPTVSGEMLYFQSNDNRLYGLDRQSGAIRWQSEPQPRSRVALTVAGDRLYLAGQDGVLYAYGW